MYFFLIKPMKTIFFLCGLPSIVWSSPEKQRRRLIKVNLFELKDIRNDLNSMTNITLQMDLIMEEIQSEQTALGGCGFFVLSKSSAATVNH